MSRNRERQQELQPGRVDYARTRLEALGYPVTEVNATTLQFTFAETKTHRGSTRQRYENKRERFIKEIGDR